MFDNNWKRLNIERVGSEGFSGEPAVFLKHPLSLKDVDILKEYSTVPK